MSPSVSDPGDSLPLEAWERIDDRCQRFEEAWKAGESPRLEDYLGGATGLEVPALLVALLRVELDYLKQGGGVPSLGAYEARFPDHTPQIREGFCRLRPNGAGAAPCPADPSPAPTGPWIRGKADSLSHPERGNVLSVPTLPGYEILGELGRGGMGVVYKARQVRADRVVALKVLLPGAHAGRADLERFRTEGEAIARLQHPNIVQVFEVDECQGLPFLSLEFCPGGGLDGKLNGTPLPPGDAVRLVNTLARAVHAAHRRGIIHRDLKPANVLLSETGCLKISDFGLAKKLDEAGNTATGEVMGTPSYMSPEQAAGKGKECGPATDVYSLGAIFYELLTGRPPFRAATSLETLLQVISSDPVPPRLLNNTIDRDAETICLKCLEKEPRRRYDSAEALAEDLDRYLKGEPIRARSYGAVQRLGRALDRNYVGQEFRLWAPFFRTLAVIALVSHLATAFLAGKGHGIGWFYGIQVATFLLMTVVFWRYQFVRRLPINLLHKQLWTLWIGFGVSYLLAINVVHRLFGAGALWGGQVTPLLALLIGVTYFAMGGVAWGRCYLLGAGHFLLAIVLPFLQDGAWFVLGGCWALSLASIGWARDSGNTSNCAIDDDACRINDGNR